MAENINKAANITLSELDLSGRSARQPSGTPAGIIGTSVRGPAFVPVTVPDITSFTSYFGPVSPDHYGTIAMYEWMQNAEAGTFVRVLGAGDGRRRDLTSDKNKGRVNGAGYIVGGEIVQEDTGIVNSNPFGDSDDEGRTWFLGALMQGSSLAEANINGVKPIIRAILHTPSGVALQLYREETNGAVAGQIGDVDASNGDDRVWLKLDGFNNPNEPDEFFVSLQSDSPRNPYNVLNTDPTLIEKKGHYLHSYYDVQDATITNAGIVKANLPRPPGTNLKQCAAFVVSGSAPWNEGTVTTPTNIGIPNFESYEDRFSAAFTPWIRSQKFGNESHKLFRFHALDDGANGNNIRVEIRNISYPIIENEWAKFTVEIQGLFNINGRKNVLETFNVDLNPNSVNFIGRIIGDAHVYYDFDKNTDSQKLVVDGFYANASRYVRVEISESVYDGIIEHDTLPMGFEGLNHLVTSGEVNNQGAAILGGLTFYDADEVKENIQANQLNFMQNAVQPPVPFRSRISISDPPNEVVSFDNSWGFSYESQGTSTSASRKSVYEASIKSFLSYHPNFHTQYQNAWIGDNANVPDVAGSILDSNRFNNNEFSLEKIAIVTNLNDKPFVDELAAARYRRNSVLPAQLVSSKNPSVSYPTAQQSIRFLKPTDLKGGSEVNALGKFTVPLQGGFDGVNVYDRNKSRLTNTAIVREFDDFAGQGGIEGPTISSYRKAINVMEERSDVDIKLLAIPGIRHESITTYAIDAVERRFDAMYIMDVEEVDKFNQVVTGSDADISTTLTAASHISKNYNTSFAAAYFPDTYQNIGNTGIIAKCPPSVAVLGAIAFNDRQAPWFAPAGFNRATLQRTDRTAVSFTTTNLDDLATARINPLATFSNAQTAGNKTIVIYGQKTLLQSESALDRVNVRRLLIEVRRQVRSIANSLLFEPNREDTLARFQSAVVPILSRIQAGQGLDRFKVQIDTSTTTQADIENNTIRGKIYLQPTKTAEFISLTFEVGNSI